MTSSRPPRAETRRAKRGSSSRRSTISDAERRDAIVSKSGTSGELDTCLLGQVEGAEDVVRRARPGHDQRVDRLGAMASHVPVRSRRRSRERGPRQRVGPRREGGRRAWRDGSRRARRGVAARRAARPRRDPPYPREGSGRGRRDRTRAPQGVSYPGASPSSALRRRLHAKLSLRRYGSSRLRSSSAAAYSGSSCSSCAIEATSSAEGVVS